MKRRKACARNVWVCVLWAALMAAIGIAHADQTAPKRQADKPKAAEAAYTYTGPHTHKNLTVFLIRGPDRLKDPKILTLEEGLAQKTVAVYETGNVNQLIIQNNSDVSVYIQSGDIVKGGKQDRCFGSDALLPPKSEKIKIQTFCVEQGRWSRRGAEAPQHFLAGNNNLSGKDLKLAVNITGSQSGVWENVRKQQNDLGENVGRLAAGDTGAATQPADVQDAASPTSLQLTLENKKLNEAVGEYEKALAGILKDTKDVIGLAFAVNGEFSGVEVYGSGKLFGKLFPKLLKAAAVEAIAEFDKDKRVKTPTVADLEACIADARKGKATEKTGPAGVRTRIKQAKHNSYIGNWSASGQPLRDSYLLNH
ncbi:MAG TPA: DUF6569 family protein [Phycisphaerae bacterium]|nr:DUF6569 family protein [Phycisphaerae bacterium]